MQDAPRRLVSIFFGGGTPSLMTPETVHHLIEDARHLFPSVNDLEVTLEANPTSVEADKFRAFAEAGINRLSLGVQSLNEGDLAALGRQHSAQQAIAALELGRGIFPRLSFDLIYARPGQTEEKWRTELRQALALVADHLSLYQLTIEPGTKFEAQHRRGTLILPEDDLAASLYMMTRNEAARFGLRDYEISNYAIPGAESRHNLTYWHYDDYLGIGPGAHSRLTLNGQLHATRRHRAPEPWAELVETHGHGTREDEILSSAMKAHEALLMGLRLREGIDTAHFRKRTGLPLEKCLDPVILEACLEEGYLEQDDQTLRATDEGRLRLEALLGQLVR